MDTKPLFAQATELINKEITTTYNYIKKYLNQQRNFISLVTVSTLEEGEILKKHVESFTAPYNIIQHLPSTLKTQINRFTEQTDKFTREVSDLQANYANSNKIQTDISQDRAISAFGINENAIKIASSEAKKKSQVMQLCAVALLTIVKNREVNINELQKLLIPSLIKEIQILDAKLISANVSSYKILVVDARKNMESNKSEKYQPIYESFIECANKLLNEAENYNKAEEYRKLLINAVDNKQKSELNLEAIRATPSYDTVSKVFQNEMDEYNKLSKLLGTFTDLPEEKVAMQANLFDNKLLMSSVNTTYHIPSPTPIEEEVEKPENPENPANPANPVNPIVYSPKNSDKCCGVACNII